MSTMLGSASRAREIAKLFEAWRRAFHVYQEVSIG
jgi:hypothetical protein